MALFDVDSYEPSGRAWDEMFEERGVTRPHYGAVHDALGALTADDFRERCIARDRSFRDQGITFSLSGEERPFPLDLLPRIISGGRVGGHRVRRDATGDGSRGVPRRPLRRGAARVLADGVVPRSLLLSSTHLHREVAGFRPANGVRIHVAGIDLVRDAAGPLPRAGGQPPHAVGDLLRHREPPGDDPGVPRAVRHASESDRSPTTRPTSSRRCGRGRRPVESIPRWWC